MSLAKLWASLAHLLKRLNRPSVAAAIFALSFFSYSYFYQGGGQNEAARLDSVRSFLDQRKLEIDTYAFNSADVITVNGHVYSGKAPGTFYMALLPFAVTEWSLRALGVDEENVYHWACYVATCFTISMAGALSLVLLYWFCLRLGASREDGTIVALTMGFGTIFFPFSTLFFSHVAAAFCLLLGFYQIYAYKQIIVGEPDANPSDEHWRLLLAGGALGFSIALEYPSAIGVGLIGLYSGEFFFRHGVLGKRITKKYLLQMAWLPGGVLVGLLPLFVYNWYAFHSPFYITYEAYSQSSNKMFEAHKKGILGIRIPLLDPSAWPQFFSNLKEITFKPLRGIFFANPVLLLAPLGFLWQIFASIDNRSASRIRDARPEFLLGLAMCLAYVVFNASFGDSITYWGGGASFGPRYLIVMLPFLAPMLLSALRNRALRALYIPLVLVSVFNCLMATAVEPRTGYSPANPLFFFYFPRYITGTLAINTIGIFSNAFMTGNSVAFNWGKLLSFPKQYQLMPLFVFWLFAMWRLDDLVGSHRRGFLFATFVLVLVAAWLPFGALF